MSAFEPCKSQITWQMRGTLVTDVNVSGKTVLVCCRHMRTWSARKKSLIEKRVVILKMLHLGAISLLLAKYDRSLKCTSLFDSNADNKCWYMKMMSTDQMSHKKMFAAAPCCTQHEISVHKPSHWLKWSWIHEWKLSSASNASERWCSCLPRRPCRCLASQVVSWEQAHGTLTSSRVGWSVEASSRWFDPNQLMPVFSLFCGAVSIKQPAMKITVTFLWYFTSNIY